MKIADLLKPATVQEDWGSSDWYPIMKSMKKYVDEKFGGKQTDENLKEAALESVEFYLEDMGYDDVEDAADSAVRTFKARRKFPESGLAEDRKISEGMFVVKNKDGVEKRFKDHDSPEAKAWKASEKKKPAVKHEKFSQGYWDAVEDRDDDALVPWTKITTHNIDSAEVERAIKAQDAGKHEDWTIAGTGEKKIDGVRCATVKLRVLFNYPKEDDLGNEEDVQDTQNFTFARNPKNPKKLDFVGY